MLEMVLQNRARYAWCMAAVRSQVADIDLVLPKAGENCCWMPPACPGESHVGCILTELTMLLWMPRARPVEVRVCC